MRSLLVLLWHPATEGSRTILKRARTVPLPPLTLDRRHPLAPQIAASVRAAIRAGRFAPGARLPPTRALATACRVSRQVVVAAFEDLAAAGDIRGRVGAGSYVARPPRVRLPCRTVTDPDGHAILLTTLHEL
jgi:DNA-binding FadR family transcriptional regulator